MNGPDPDRFKKLPEPVNLDETIEFVVAAIALIPAAAVKVAWASTTP